MEEIYLPHPSSAKPNLLGEYNFFDNKFWKLAVMFGYDWRSLELTKRGFSFMNVCSKKYENKVYNIIDFLSYHDIPFRLEESKAGWALRLIISTKKSYLNIIDNEYKKYYDKKIKECKYFCTYNKNTYIDQESYNELLKEGKDEWYESIDLLCYA